MKFNNKDAFYMEGTEKSAAKNILIVGAHPDDAEFMAYQVISKAFRNSELAVHVVVLTDGANSPRMGEYASYTGEMMKEARKREQVRAMEVGEYSSLAMLNYTSGAIKNQLEEAKEDLIKIMDYIRPQCIYLHNPFDNHPTHIGACLLVIRALKDMSDTDYVEKAYGCEVWQSLEWLDNKDKIFADTSLHHEELFYPLVNCFVSQIAGGKRYDRALLGRWAANATFNDSHSVDAYDYVSFMCDLTDVVKNRISLKEYVSGCLSRFFGKFNDAYNNF